MKPAGRTWMVVVGSLAAVFIVVVFASQRTRPHDPTRLAAEAHAAVRQGQWSVAEDRLQRLARERPLKAEELTLWADLELGREHPEKAVELLTSIPVSEPIAARSRLAAARIEKLRHRARAMERLLLDALRLDPRLAAAHGELIYLYSMQARRSELNDQYRALARIQPLTFDDVFLWTVSLEDVWINDAIRGTLEQFIAADPEDHGSKLALAAVLLHAGELDACESLLQLVPENDVEATILRARVALNRSDFGRLGRLLKGLPDDNVEVAVLRGQMAMRAGETSKAEREFRRALTEDPSKLDALQGLALALRQSDPASAKGYLKRAEQWRGLRQALQKAEAPASRQDRSLLVTLGEICEALDQKAEAEGWYRLALISDPLDQTLQRALYRLREANQSGSSASNEHGSARRELTTRPRQD